MAIRTHISCSENGNRAIVTKDGALLTANVPPTSSAVKSIYGNRGKYKLLNGLLGSTGLDSGITNQNVNATLAAPQKFYMAANDNYDIYITHIITTIVDITVKPNTFGNVGVLVNGFDLNLIQEGSTEALIMGAKTGGQLLVQGGMFNPFGTINDPNTIIAFTAGDDALICTFPVGQIVPGGIRLASGSLNRIESVVKDNLTGLTSLDVRIVGYIDNF